MIEDLKHVYQKCANMSNNIRVVCRFRPINKIEQTNGSSDAIVRFEDVDTVKLEVSGSIYRSTNPASLAI